MIVLSPIYKALQQTKRFTKKCENFQSYFANFFGEISHFFAKMNEAKNAKKNFIDEFL